MTRKEAIELLRELSNFVATPPETDEALNMAIEALEQEETLQNLTKPNKSDLISRQAAIEVARKYLLDNYITDADWHADGIESEIESLPSAEPKTGEWQRFNYSDGDVMECTNCGYRDWRDRWLEDEAHNYCPYCGARMESEEE